MLRTPSIRRLIITMLLLAGPLTQFQTLYACESMMHEHGHERPNMVCCCEEPGQMAMTMMAQDQAGVMDGGCCNVSYELSQVTQASAQFQQVLMLAAAQPPPVLVVVAFHFSDIIPRLRDIHLEPDSPSPLPDKPIYLLTSRFRI